MSIQATGPFPSYLDSDGTPLSQGYVYFGTSGANPETTPQAVYWDEALTIPAAQPLRTLNGFLVRNGTPASVYLSAVYSITVRNKNRVLLYSSLSNVGLPFSTAMIPVVSAATLAAARDALGVSKKIKGYQAISLSHFSDTLEPSVTSGSEIEVDGTFYEFPIDEAAVAGGWAAIAVSTVVYMYLVPAGAAHTWIYSATAPTWDTDKQGWYNGANRAFGMLYKDAASLYQHKEIIPPLVQSSSPPYGVARNIVITSGALGALYVFGDTEFILSAASTATLPVFAPVGCRLTFKIKTTATSTISAAAGQTIGTTSSTSFVLYEEEDYVTLEWDGVSIWYVVSTNGPVQSASQNNFTTTVTTGAWTAVGNGLTLGVIQPGIYDIELTAQPEVTNSYLGIAIGNGTTPISETSGTYSNSASVIAASAHLSCRNYVLTAAATIQGIYYSGSASNIVNYNTPHFISKIKARRIG